MKNTLKPLEAEQEESALSLWLRFTLKAMMIVGGLFLALFGVHEIKNMRIHVDKLEIAGVDIESGKLESKVVNTNSALAALPMSCPTNILTNTNITAQSAASTAVVATNTVAPTDIVKAVPSI